MDYSATLLSVMQTDILFQLGFVSVQTQVCDGTGFSGRLQTEGYTCSFQLIQQYTDLWGN